MPRPHNTDTHIHIHAHTHVYALLGLDEDRARPLPPLQSPWCNSPIAWVFRPQQSEKATALWAPAVFLAPYVFFSVPSACGAVPRGTQYG